jgi:hypothetical protein
VTIKNAPADSTGPVVAPCSNGLQLTWNTNNSVTDAHFLQNSSPNKSLAYLPKHDNGFDLFFQTPGDTLASAEWLRNGKAAGAVAVPAGVDRVFWNGATPPASPYASQAHSGRVRDTSAVVAKFYWRHTSSNGNSTATAPSTANGLDMGWYLNKYQSGPTRGCVRVGASAWTSPAMPIEFLTGGRLNSPVGVLGCPLDQQQQPIPYNDVNLVWRTNPSGPGNVLVALQPTFNDQPDYQVSTSALPQPPAGTTEAVLGFHLDNFKDAYWTHDGSTVKTVSVHKYAKVADWHG